MTPAPTNPMLNSLREGVKPQMSAQLLLAFLSTSVISVIAGAIIAGAYGLRARRNEYINDYYKIVIARRIAAYEKLESLIVWLKTSVVDEKDKRPYHLLFSFEDGEKWDRPFVVLYGVMSQSLWLSDEVFAKTRDLSYLMFHFKEPGSIIEFAKENYEKVASIRAELERLLAIDMLSLHEVTEFLVSKNKPDPGLHPVYLKN